MNISFMTPEYEDQIRIARKMISTASRMITEKIPEFTRILDRFNYDSVCTDIHISTDGKAILYNPRNVIKECRDNGIRQIQKELMHVTIHILKGDILTYRESAHRELISAIIDMEVTEILRKMGLYGRYDNDISEAERLKMYYSYKYQKQEMYSLTKGMDATMLSDDHSLWIESDISKEDVACMIEITLGGELAAEFLSDPESFAGKFAEHLKKHGYKMISTWGNGMEEINEEHHALDSTTDYRKEIRNILKMITGEKESADIIDRNLYCFGLAHYGNTPLIEPGEDECEIKGVKRLAIAIDTSGSCNGAVADRFLGELIGLIRQSEEYMSDDAEISLFTCDCSVQSEEHYDLKELNAAGLVNRTLCGFGGTSFIPVFKRMDEIRKKDGKAYDALIYLSDGYGDYPDAAPDYPVVFVIPKNVGDNDGIPGYVTKTFIDP